MASNTGYTGSMCLDQLPCCTAITDAELNITWSVTAAGMTASVSCDVTPFFSPKSHYLLALRKCDSNGSWLEPNYSACSAAMRQELLHDVLISRVLSGVYVIGGAVSMVLLSTALFIFCYFKNLHCERIWIHCNLVVAFILRHIMLLIRLRKVLTYILMTDRSRDELVDNQMPQIARPGNYWHDAANANESVSAGTSEAAGNSTFAEQNFQEVTDAASEVFCKTLMMLEWYTFLCTMCWMFVEAAYLFVRIFVSVFDSENKTLFWGLVSLGWGGSLVIVIISSIVLQHKHKVPCWYGAATTDYGWLMYGPFLAMLVANICFMICIIAVLVTKMKGMKTAETKQIRVALRAIVLLVPLFGLTHVVAAFSPSPAFEDMYRILNAVLQSIQGTFVALLYCFMNQEVQSVIRSRWVRFKAIRNPSLQYADLSMVPSAVRSSRIPANVVTTPVTKIDDF